MNQDDIDKTETLIGYLKYLKEITPNEPPELTGVITEAEEWIIELKEKIS